MSALCLCVRLREPPWIQKQCGDFRSKTVSYIRKEECLPAPPAPTPPIPKKKLVRKIVWQIILSSKKHICCPQKKFILKYFIVIIFPSSQQKKNCKKKITPIFFAKNLLSVYFCCVKYLYCQEKKDHQSYT